MKTILLLIVQLFLISSLFSEVTAVYNNDKVEISWNNPLHIKVDYFVIERSKTGKKFKAIQKINTKENVGHSIEYFEIDYKPFNVKAFYRIKQVDIDGNSYYSKIVYAENFNNIKPIVSLFSFSKKNTEVKNYKGKDILVVLVNANQEEFIARVDVLEERKELIVTYANVRLPTGIYLVTGTSDDTIYGKKINVMGNYSSTAYSLSTK